MPAGKSAAITTVQSSRLPTDATFAAESVTLALVYPTTSNATQAEQTARLTRMHSIVNLD